MTVHRLKTWPVFYQALLEGKRAELRKNDRKFKTGDAVDLAEWDPKTAAFTSRHQVFEIVSVADLSCLGPQFLDYVLLTLRDPK